MKYETHLDRSMDGELQGTIDEKFCYKNEHSFLGSYQFEKVFPDD